MTSQYGLENQPAILRLAAGGWRLANIAEPQ